MTLFSSLPRSGLPFDLRELVSFSLGLFVLNSFYFPRAMYNLQTNVNGEKSATVWPQGELREPGDDETEEEVVRASGGGPSRGSGVTITRLDNLGLSNPTGAKGIRTKPR